MYVSGLMGRQRIGLLRCRYDGWWETERVWLGGGDESFISQLILFGTKLLEML